MSTPDLTLVRVGTKKRLPLDSAPAPDDERRYAEYLKWSADRAGSFLSELWTRKTRLEAKSGALVGVVNLVGGYVIFSRQRPGPSATFDGVVLTLRLVALVVLAIMVGCWFASVRVQRLGSPNMIALTQEDGTPFERDLVLRYKRVRDNLLQALAESSPRVEELSEWNRRCERSALVVLVLVFVLLVLEIVT